ncbi:MAG: LysR family transcriptional regulator [Pseudomonadota bacterium]
MSQLNYHHLRYFRQVAKQGHLGEAAATLNVSASALSMQIKTLEERLGHALFDRVGRKLVLTEAGRIALDHAERIFSAGDDLIAALARTGTHGTPLRIGALSTMSRNFQMQFLQPLLAIGETDVVLVSGDEATLLAGLQNLTLDVVLSTQVPRGGDDVRFAAKKISQQPAALHGHPKRLGHDSLSALLAQEPLILPTDSTIRSAFEGLLDRLAVKPHVAAVVDDMAMVRLLAREGAGVAVAPAVVFADEIAQGIIATAPFDLGIVEPFYAVTLPRDFPHPALRGLLAGDQP